MEYQVRGTRKEKGEERVKDRTRNVTKGKTANVEANESWIYKTRKGQQHDKETC